MQPLCRRDSNDSLQMTFDGGKSSLELNCIQSGETWLANIGKFWTNDSNHFVVWRPYLTADWT